MGVGVGVRVGGATMLCMAIVVGVGLRVEVLGGVGVADGLLEVSREVGVELSVFRATSVSTVG